MDSCFLEVTVPINFGPGEELLLLAPNGLKISAIIPEGHGPGHIFHVRLPSAPIVAQSDTVENEAPPPIHEPQYQQLAPQQPRKYKRCSEEMLLLHKKGIVKIKVPPGHRAGDKFKVRIPDGRNIDVVVPPGNVSEFQIKVPTKKQNWHDNPLAVAPMAFAPFFM
eukprot:CAMPEP_0194287672 /NCGR_PEP_ID=MMETSP0169-20130528/35265_1 /TAXON_ID=218684 /ORGANISM="Corethron pennatum, Strain L29A3" /LENGTH=164 /DNA_ID=CAMNT_0039034445 /DNA_START=206 /DNA_END=700 /DNA_ORIENTATION=+